MTNLKKDITLSLEKSLEAEIEKLGIEYDGCYDRCRAIQYALDGLDAQLKAVMNDKELANAGVTWCND